LLTVDDLILFVLSTFSLFVAFFLLLVQEFLLNRGFLVNNDHDHRQIIRPIFNDANPDFIELRSTNQSIDL